MSAGVPISVDKAAGTMRSRIVLCFTIALSGCAHRAVVEDRLTLPELIARSGAIALIDVERESTCESASLLDDSLLDCATRSKVLLYLKGSGDETLTFEHYVTNRGFDGIRPQRPFGPGRYIVFLRGVPPNMFLTVDVHAASLDATGIEPSAGQKSVGPSAGENLVRLLLFGAMNLDNAKLKERVKATIGVGLQVLGPRKTVELLGQFSEATGNKVHAGIACVELSRMYLGYDQCLIDGDLARGQGFFGAYTQNELEELRSALIKWRTVEIARMERDRNTWKNSAARDLGDEAAAVVYENLMRKP